MTSNGQIGNFNSLSFSAAPACLLNTAYSFSLATFPLTLYPAFIFQPAFVGINWVTCLTLLTHAFHWRDSILLFHGDMQMTNERNQLQITHTFTQSS